MRRAWSLVAMLMVVVGVALGQSLPMRRITTEEGLAGRTVAGAVQSADGYLWFTTTTGLSRFDGKHFKNFTQADGLPNDDLRLPYQDSKGRLWVYCLNGEFAFFQKDRICSAKNTPWLKKLQFIKKAPPCTIIEDSTNQMWFATSQEFIRLQDTNVITGFIDAEPGASIPGFCQFLPTIGDSMRLVAQGQILKWNGNCFEWETAKYVPLPGSFSAVSGDSILFTSSEGLIAQSGAVQRLLIPSEQFMGSVMYTFSGTKGNLLVGYRGGGVWCYSSNPLNSPRELFPTGTQSNLGRIILQDHEGNLWFTSSENGLILVPLGVSDVMWLNRETGLRNAQITAVAIDMHDNLWFGDHLGNVGIWSNTSGLRYIVDSSPEDYGNRILSIVEQSNGEIWVGSRSAIFNITPNDLDPVRSEVYSVPLPNSIIDFQAGIGKRASFTVFSDIYGLELDPLKITRIPLNKGFLKTKYQHCWASDSTLWMSTVDGLAYWRADKYGLADSINSKVHARIQDILVLGQDSLMLGTNGEGIIVCLNGRVLGRIRKGKGIPSSNCRQLVRQGTSIWAVTDAGLTQLRLGATGNFTSRNYVETDGLQSKTLDGMSIGKQRIAVFGSSGITLLPLTIENQTPPIPYLTIDSLVAGGRRFITDKIPWESRELRIQYSGIAFLAPSSVHFQYRLTHGGEVGAWKSTHASELNFSTLVAGDYQFELRAAYKGGAWSSIKSIKFRINKPYWQEVWFFVILIVLSAGMVYGILRWRLSVTRRKFKQEIEMRARINALENKAIQAMMSPHFIFNVMNSIRHLMHLRDVDAADSALTRFAKLVRANLTLVSKPLIALEDEVEFLRDYLAVESLRFDQDFHWEVLVDETLQDEEVVLPSMLLQPYVENAVIHGLLPTKKGGQIKVHFRLTDDKWMEVLITDDGIGIGQSRIDGGHESQGMNLIQERLRLLGLLVGQEILVSIFPAYPNDQSRPGTAVLLRLPLDLGE